MTLSVAVSVDWSAGQRVRIDVTASPAVTDVVAVYRVHESGERFLVLTDQTPVMVGAWSGYDYHAPFNQTVTYVAETDSQVSAASSPVFLVSDETWLVSATDPTLSLPVEAILEMSALSWDDPAQKFQPLNSSRPVHYWSRSRSGPSFSLTVFCEDQEQSDRVLALVRAGGPVLLNMHREPVRWMWAQLSKPTMQPPGGKWRTDYRTWQFGVEETTQPDSDVLSEWNFDGLAAAFPDFDTATAAYADFTTMSLDVRL